ncbi:MAG: NOP5/NOP56 family protein [Candidatus Woesearchaeota archaeon]
MHISTIVGVFDTNEKTVITMHTPSHLHTAMDFVHSAAFSRGEINPVLLKELRKHIYHDQIVAVNIALVKERIAESVTMDNHIVQAINAIEEITKSANTLIKRVREWYGYYFPELEHHIEDNEIFVRRILQKSKEEFMQELSLTVSMGPSLATREVEMIFGFAREVGDLFTARQKLVAYLEEVMGEYCPNLLAVTGVLIGAKLFEKAGSLRKLSLLPSSTIQLLGAEKALFRHLRNKRIKPPKHGFILSHPFLMESKDKGKAARILSAKISIAVKVDYFKGEFIGDKLKEKLHM